jgi:hypothetical protein
MLQFTLVIGSIAHIYEIEDKLPGLMNLNRREFNLHGTSKALNYGACIICVMTIILDTVLYEKAFREIPTISEMHIDGIRKLVPQKYDKIVGRTLNISRLVLIEST